MSTHREGCTKPLGKGYDIMCEGCGEEVAGFLAGTLRGKLYDAEREAASLRARLAEAERERDFFDAERQKVVVDLEAAESSLASLQSRIEGWAKGMEAMAQHSASRSFWLGQARRAREILSAETP